MGQVLLKVLDAHSHFVVLEKVVRCFQTRLTKRAEEPFRQNGLGATATYAGTIAGIDGTLVLERQVFARSNYLMVFYINQALKVQAITHLFFVASPKPVSELTTDTPPPRMIPMVTVRFWHLIAC